MADKKKKAGKKTVTERAAKKAKPKKIIAKKKTKSEKIEPIPSWLEMPPSPQIDNPVQSRLQVLPFDKLSWEDFERLCLRLVRLESGVEYCQLYGRRGQGQRGIDIYARKSLDQKYRVYQCKRVKEINENSIKKIVSQFCKGKWVKKSEAFILCTSLGLNDIKLQDAIEKQNELLKPKGISFIPWDKHELSMKLKGHPSLVDDFFGRPWVKSFCGSDAANNLGLNFCIFKVMPIEL